MRAPGLTLTAGAVLICVLGSGCSDSSEQPAQRSTHTAPAVLLPTVPSTSTATAPSDSFQRSGPGTRLALGESAIVDMPAKPTGAHTVKMTVKSWSKAPQDHYELLNVDPSKRTLFFMRFDAELLAKSGSSAGAFTPSPTVLRPQGSAANEGGYIVTTAGKCLAPTNDLVEVGDTVVDGCFAFDIAGPPIVGVVFSPHPMIDFVTWEVPSHGS